jgi:hypothetical protein
MTNLIGTSDGRPSNKCPDHYDELYCYNGGTCVRFAVEQDALYSCECLDGFIGERCETKYPTSIKNSEYFYCFFLFYSKITPFLPIASNLLRFSNGWDLNWKSAIFGIILGVSVAILFWGRWVFCVVGNFTMLVSSFGFVQFSLEVTVIKISLG